MAGSLIWNAEGDTIILETKTMLPGRKKIREVLRGYGIEVVKFGQTENSNIKPTEKKKWE